MCSIGNQAKDHDMTFVDFPNILAKDQRRSFLQKNTSTSIVSQAKMHFQDQLIVYESTAPYLQYQQYLQDFKDKNDASLQLQRDLEARTKVTFHMN